MSDGWILINSLFPRNYYRQRKISYKLSEELKPDYDPETLFNIFFPDSLQKWWQYCFFPYKTRCVVATLVFKTKCIIRDMYANGGALRKANEWRTQNQNNRCLSGERGDGEGHTDRAPVLVPRWWVHKFIMIICGLYTVLEIGILLTLFNCILLKILLFYNQLWFQILIKSEVFIKLHLSWCNYLFQIRTFRQKEKEKPHFSYTHGTFHPKGNQMI